LLDEVEPPFHVDESVCGQPVLLLHLCATNAQQGRDALRVDTLREDRRDVVEAEAELTEGDDPVQALQLRRIVRAVAAELIHVCRNEQTRGIPVPQHPVGHLTDLREGSDGQHASVLPPATVSGSSIPGGARPTPPVTRRTASRARPSRPRRGANAAPGW